MNGTYAGASALHNAVKSVSFIFAFGTVTLVCLKRILSANRFLSFIFSTFSKVYRANFVNFVFSSILKQVFFEVLPKRSFIGQWRGCGIFALEWRENKFLGRVFEFASSYCCFQGFYFVSIAV